jgi:hypothetical protein
LAKKGLIEVRENFNNFNEPYTVYAVTDEGMDWLHDNQSRLVLRWDEEKGAEDEDDDIPF